MIFLMKDFDAELQQLHKLRKAAMKELERENRLKEREYRRLALTSGLVTFVAALANIISRATIPHTIPQRIVIPLGYGLTTVVLAVIFLVRAHRSEIGIKGYLKNEKNLLINEMPNIFQILGLLGFLNVLLKQQWIKVVVTLVITFLLLIYLASKRREAVTRNAKLEGRITSDVTVPLGLVLGLLIALGIYQLASLISIQF